MPKHRASNHFTLENIPHLRRAVCQALDICSLSTLRAQNSDWRVVRGRRGVSQCSLCVLGRYHQLGVHGPSHLHMTGSPGYLCATPTERCSLLIPQVRKWAQKACRVRAHRYLLPLFSPHCQACGGLFSAAACFLPGGACCGQMCSDSSS